MPLMLPLMLMPFIDAAATRREYRYIGIIRAQANTLFAFAAMLR